MEVIRPKLLIDPDIGSGKDFEYKKTSDGFILRCQSKDLSKDEIYEYKFKVKK